MDAFLGVQQSQPDDRSSPHSPHFGWYVNVPYLSSAMSLSSPTQLSAGWRGWVVGWVGGVGWLGVGWGGVGWGGWVRCTARSTVATPAPHLSALQRQHMAGVQQRERQGAGPP
jgi:hypothetical protein